MKVALLAALLVVATLSVAADTPSDDKLAVQKVVKEAYVDGVHARPDPEAMRRGFHPDFRMLVLRDGKLSAVALEEWIARMQKAAADKPGAKLPAVRHEFPLVDVTGSAAVVKVELHKDGKHVFSDYISLYKFADGWKIVGKTFYAHP